MRRRRILVSRAALVCDLSSTFILEPDLPVEIPGEAGAAASILNEPRSRPSSWCNFLDGLRS